MLYEARSSKVGLAARDGLPAFSEYAVLGPVTQRGTLRSFCQGTYRILRHIDTGVHVRSHTLWLGHNFAADAGLPGPIWVLLDPHIRDVIQGHFSSLPVDCINEPVQEVRSQDSRYQICIHL
ncbi:hypothetical protein T05_8606 [Trichinella murrelli]|uniref:Uncharacterized protein n=1 Tax=Trichinella murrelli TaxID=144512 RepID=A0A0V0TFN9_9BILA|nr:hypothetical protein T05_8606 [Trichinella murrelli]